MTAQNLLDQLLEIKATYGTLDVPISLYNEDRYPISKLDIFTDGEDEHLHSIDIDADEQ